MIAVEELAVRIAGGLDSHPYFAHRDRTVMQVLCLAEEAGEFVGAWRRWSGNARRTGEWQDVVDELADVVIAAYVTAQYLHIDLAAAINQKGQHILTRGWKQAPN